MLEVRHFLIWNWFKFKQRKKRENESVINKIYYPGTIAINVTIPRSLFITIPIKDNIKQVRDAIWVTGPAFFVYWETWEF